MNRALALTLWVVASPGAFAVEPTDGEPSVSTRVGREGGYGRPFDWGWGTAPGAVALWFTGTKALDGAWHSIELHIVTHDTAEHRWTTIELNTSGGRVALPVHVDVIGTRGRGPNAHVFAECRVALSPEVVRYLIEHDTDAHLLEGTRGAVRDFDIDHIEVAEMLVELNGTEF